jgi:hypothetical protein
VSDLELVLFQRPPPADIQFLREIGFLEPIGANFKVPMLYRDGLSITQGKAFIAGDTSDDEQSGQ